tara:strand:- start:3016 stop:7311 length:4296 start_codon:yes stop_codon:yes gene_type:complete
MAQSAQAKELILEIGGEIGTQSYDQVVQSGTVSKQVFDTCSLSSSCNTDILNSNSKLDPFGDWHNLIFDDIQQGGNSPSVYSNNGSNPAFNVNGGNGAMNYIFPYNYGEQANEANVIMFSFETAAGNNPNFNGINYSNNSTSQTFTAVNNMVEDGREMTEQGRMLYFVPLSSSPYDINISFEILEGSGKELLVRGSGGISIGEHLHNNGYSNVTIAELNTVPFWANFSAYISPYVHKGNWEYLPTGNVRFDSTTQTIHGSYAPSTANPINYASIVTEDGAFGVRSSDSLFECFESWTQGYELDITIDNMQNCTLEVLTYTDSSIDDFAIDYADINQVGTDWVFEEITSTGNHNICVPYHYNTINTEESQNPNMVGLGGGWTTSVLVQTGGGGLASGAVASKRFYNNQYKFLKVKPIDSALPYSVTISTFELRNAGYNMRTIQTPTYSSNTIKVPSYDYQYLDVFDRDKVPMALTFNSGDLRDPSKRSTGYSKTFELPASDRNQKILKSMTSIGSDRQVDDISWQKARVSSNGIVVFNGFARIEKSITDSGGRYSCHILQDPSYWPELIGDDKLCDLQFADPLGQNYVKSYATVVDSWTKTVDDIPYVYPAINYGEWSKDSNANQQSHSISDFHPAVYAKAIVDKIFESIGYSVDSNFFNTQMFKKLIIPYTSDEDYNAVQNNALGDDGDYSSQASQASYFNLPDTPATGVNYQTNRTFYPSIPCQNGCTNYTQGSSASLQNGYTVPFTGRYTVHYQAQIRCNYPGWGCTECTNQIGYWSAWMHVDGLCPMPNNGGLQNINGASTYAHGFGSSTIRSMTGSASDTVSSCDSDGDWTTCDFTAELDLIQGEKIQVALYSENRKPFCEFDADIKDQDFAVWPVVDQGFVPATEISLSDSLGCGVKQIDFLKGITEMFNLYWTADNDAKTVTVEPYDSFYGSGRIVDWSQKIDRKGWTDKFLIDELAKNIRYKYKEDSSDDIVKVYNESMETELWSIDITNNELYRKKDSTLGTTVFSPTFRIKNNDNGGDATFVDSGQWPIMPCMWGGDVNWGWFNGTSRPDNSTNFNLRILNYYGLSNEVGTWTLLDDTGAVQTLNSYPYAHTYNYNHAGAGAIEDNLSWYDIGANATYQKGLFDRFYGRLYEKISGGSALRTCMMELTQVDINQFDFRNIVQIDMDGGVSTYWTVNKIIDYTPGKEGLTKVELVEWKYGFYVDKDGKIVAYNGKPTNYGGLGSNGLNPSGGFVQFSHGTTGQEIIIQDNGVYYIEPVDPQLPASTAVNTSNNITTELLNSNPSLANNTQVSPEKLIQSNQYNGLTNNQSVSNALLDNNIVKNGVALGVGLNASVNQTVLGSFNVPNDSDTFQVGGGFHNTKTGAQERVNTLSVDKDGDFSVYGGEVVAEFSTREHSITGDVYYTDGDGARQKVYLKTRINKR